ncbi:MAG: arylsulfatase [Gemmatimonas sp. SG8_28]|nr:MAG: arylsulfatase [Gemmatimonas sp. SG8_28]
MPLLPVFLAACQPVYDGPPNVVLILADDLGWQDVGVYGATGFATPSLDRMAAEGMRFTSFYAPNAACSPTRAAIMTGSYAPRVGIPEVLSPRSRRGLGPAEVTIAELLREQGYATIAVGKWHLGDHPRFLPTNHGFDSYFGIPYSNDMSPVKANNPREGANVWYPELPLVRDTTIVEREPDQTQLTRRYTEEVVHFIEDNAERPFFAYLAYSFPHVPLWASERFAGSTERGLYGDVVAEIDWSVGEVLAALERLGLDERTLVVFTSDNGPWLVFGNHAGSAGPFREGKATTFEGGHRVPTIFRWPGRIPAGREIGELATGMDLLPTFARLANATLPTDRIVDGHDLWPLLSGADDAVSPYERFFYYRSGELQAVRSGKWKLHVPHRYPSMVGAEVGADGMPGRYARGEIGIALYDLDADPGERVDVAAEHPDVVQRLLGLGEWAREDIGDELTDRIGENARPAGQVEEPWAEQLAYEEQ